MRRALSLLPLVFLIVASPVSAQKKAPPKILINPDRQPLIQGEPFGLTIHIETSSRGDPEVRLPRFGGLRILRRSESHPMSFSFSFGLGRGRQSQTKRESNYSFVLVADKPGKHRLDPVLVTLDGVQYRGEPYTLNIVPSGAPSSRASPTPRGPQTAQPATPSAPVQAPPGHSAQSVDGAELDGARVDPDYFVQTHLSTHSAVVGEPIVMTIYLYSASSVSDLEVMREPGTEGFWAENLLPANRRFTTETVEVAGRLYDRGVLRRAVLFPIKPGKLTVAPTLVDLVVSRGGFFSKRRSVKRSSLTAQVEVTQLPTESQPAGFDPANVGRYTFNAAIDRRDVKVGEPITLTLTVRGEGNLRNLALPELAEIEGFKIYAPETDVDVRAQGKTVTGTRASRILMIPKEPGEYNVPKISWSFFDPQAQVYKTLSSRPLRVTVRRGASTMSSTAEQPQAPAPKTAAGQDRLNRQLRSILSRAELEAGNGALTVTRPWFLGLAFGVPLLYLALIIGLRTRRKIAEGHIKGRSKRADSVAMRNLADLGKRSGDMPTEQFFAELSRLLVGFLEDRLEAPVAGDTVSDLRARLAQRGFSSEQAEQVVSEMESSDFARFARSTGKEAERREALKRMEQLIRELAAVRVSPLKEKR